MRRRCEAAAAGTHRRGSARRLGKEVKRGESAIRIGYATRGGKRNAVRGFRSENCANFLLATPSGNRRASDDHGPYAPLASSSGRRAAMRAATASCVV
eukprot:CAMPEP_0174851348 /NCGR_PEP_ID=MMETSP1114-20130205/23072_1 /TAXON_ID=312471 /ORGANISM="Neobodo designis, Strain CCAP 1951/1" /LENGTH=97 /DNA_ID=CAMNT_0016085883 /DNA_START=572 /DNA_END=862 /DNA_ORIENTATION=-